MKTPDEIKNCLKRHHANLLNDDALVYIQQLETEIAKWKNVAANPDVVKIMSSENKQLRSSLEKVSKALIGKVSLDLNEILSYVGFLKSNLEAYEQSAIKCCYESKCSKEIKELEEAFVRLNKERDEAVASLHGSCEVCKYEKTEICLSCIFGKDSSHRYDNWEWRGVLNVAQEE